MTTINREQDWQPKRVRSLGHWQGGGRGGFERSQRKADNDNRPGPPEVDVDHDGSGAGRKVFTRA